MIKKEIIETIKKELVAEMKKMGFIDTSDNTERIVDSLIKKHLESLNEEEDDTTELFSEIDEEITKFLKKEYNEVGEIGPNGDYTGYFTKEKFETIEELEKKFNIGE